MSRETGLIAEEISASAHPRIGASAHRRIRAPAHQRTVQLRSNAVGAPTASRARDALRIHPLKRFDQKLIQPKLATVHPRIKLIGDGHSPTDCAGIRADL